MSRAYECRRLATHIATAASAMGLVANVELARHYVYVYVVSAVEADKRVRIRCSDHDDSDWYVWAGECPSRIIARLADHFGMMVPMGYRPEDYAARSRSNKTGECRRLATHIATAASAMGLVANVELARHYVYVASAVEADERVKIRCCDHDDKHGGSDWYVWAGECPSRIIARLADHFGMMVPMGYRPEDYAARSDIAKAAAATRSQARRATESDMTTFTKSLRSNKTGECSRLATIAWTVLIWLALRRAHKEERE